MISGPIIVPDVMNQHHRGIVGVLSPRASGDQQGIDLSIEHARRQIFHQTGDDLGKPLL